MSPPPKKNHLSFYFGAQKDRIRYISKDEENEISTKKEQRYREIITPNYDKIDFVHIFTLMNRIKLGNTFININAYLVWRYLAIIEDIIKQNRYL